MDLHFNCFDERSEIQRLSHLLPIDLLQQVSIIKSRETNSPLIATEITKKKQFAIKIDFGQWQKIKANQRDLLFWHELARIEGKTLQIHTKAEVTVMLVGAGLALMEISAENVISLASVLVAVALAAHQLYQRNWGERSWREVCNADRRAIYLATEFGYSFSQASGSLYNALKMLDKFSQKSGKQKYQVRLRALEILAKSDWTASLG